MAKDRTLVEVDGRRLTLSNLDKVLYPATGTTKAEVIGYYAEVAGVMIPHLSGRPVTRKRWPDGVQATPFFRKDLEPGAPQWLQTRTIEHSDRTVTYPLVDSPAVLTWLGQSAALELHVPQWRFADGDESGSVRRPDRMVFDLDPGPEVGLAECAQVAFWIRELLGRAGMDAVPVTSGSKGLHLYLRLDGKRSSEEVSATAHQLADAIAADHPDLVTSRMAKSLRPGKVFIDWSQNNGNKTTIAPYSLRGRDYPMVAAPRTWEELEDPELGHLDFAQVLERLAEAPDPMVALGFGGGEHPRRRSVGSTPALARDHGTVVRSVELDGAQQVSDDKLAVYRAKRSADRTPEPVPEAGPLPVGAGNTFVIQEHHARRLHWDLRLEHEGVLVSWAVPRGLPETPSQNRLAVQTEDHPMEYAAFSGSIPMGEYGGGEMTIWDSGTYVLEKWWPNEVMFELQGTRARGQFVLIRTEERNWLLHKLKPGHVPRVWPSEPGAPLEAGAVGELPAASRSTAKTPAAVAPDAAASSRTATISTATSSTATSSTVPGSTPTSPPPSDLAPMLAAAGTVESLTDADDWRFEGKWDGIRALAEIGGGRFRLTSRTGRDITHVYPELAGMPDLVRGHSVVLDGEIVALDAKGRSDFGLMQQRMNLSKAAEIRRAAGEVPVEFWCFDLLHLDGVSLLRKSYDDRRRLLEALAPASEYVSVPEQLPGTAAEALARSRELRWEGIVAKRGGSSYRSGQRAQSWIKLKNQSTQEGVVVGWRRGAGRREGGVGSLLMGVYTDSGDLVYIGRVGTGFTDAALDRLHDQLKPLQRKTSPLTDGIPRLDAKDAVWVRPELVGEVTFVEWTKDGRLRAPSWRGLRPDKRPTDVRREG